MRILIAEDEESIAKGIESILQAEAQYKHQILFAENGQQALQIASSTSLDLIITDIRMFRMTGIEFIEQLKKHNITCKIIIISGYSNFEYVQRALRVGVMDYLLKPIDKKRLLELVDQVWRELPEKYVSKTIANPINHDFFNLDFEKEEYPRSLQKVVGFIVKNYTLDLSLQMLSEELMLHPNYISTLINKHFMVSFNYVLDYIRLEKACELLVTTDMTIAEISHLVGYNNERRLYTAFRKRLRSSPGDFRKKQSAL
jgi:YesN/AraC family two-component response regulator